MGDVVTLGDLRQETLKKVMSLEVVDVVGKNGSEELERLNKLWFSQLAFKVILLSSRPQHGEVDVIVTVTGSLKQAMEEAIAQFKAVNRCAVNLQGIYRVMVILPGEPEITAALPERWWGQWRQ